MGALRAANRRVYSWIVLALVFLTIGSILVRNSTAWSATSWMFMYSPADFRTTRDLVTFLKELWAPIPPVISAVEIIDFQLTRTTDIVTNYLYKVTLVGAYLLALWLTYPSLARLVLSFVVSIIFLWATVLVHPVNPQVYDAFLPFLILMFLALLRVVTSVPAGRSAVAYVVSGFAGFFLSMAELARPFMLAILPILLVGAYLRLRGAPKRRFAVLLVPLALFSGVWHAHLFMAHHQILSTNHSGFNLLRAWRDAPIRLNALVQEDRTPVAKGRWPNLNTAEHNANSQVLEHDVLAYILTNPGKALPHAVARIAYFISAPVSTYQGTNHERSVPPHPVLSIYRVVAPASFLFMLANIGVLVFFTIKAGRRFHLVLASAENLLLIVTFLLLLVLSLGEANEEARLVISTLPLLAAFPVASAVRSGPNTRADNHSF
jgi:hypothetical protein